MNKYDSTLRLQTVKLEHEWPAELQDILQYLQQGVTQADIMDLKAKFRGGREYCDGLLAEQHIGRTIYPLLSPGSPLPER